MGLLFPVEQDSNVMERGVGGLCKVGRGEELAGWVVLGLAGWMVPVPPLWSAVKVKACLRVWDHPGASWGRRGSEGRRRKREREKRERGQLLMLCSANQKCSLAQHIVPQCIISLAIDCKRLLKFLIDIIHIINLSEIQDIA